MASRLILKDVKAPLRFLLRNPASSGPSAQTIQNILLPIPRQSTSGLLPEVCLSDKLQLSRVSNSTFDHGFRINVGGKREPAIEEVDEFSENEDESESDLDCSDEFSGDEFYDNDDSEPQDDD